MADNDILLKLKLLDEYSKELQKFTAEIRKTESDTKKSASSMSSGFSGIADKLNTLDRIGVPGLGRLASGFDKAAEAQSSFLGNAGLMVAGVGAAITAAAALGYKMVEAASEGEQASVRLSAALKAQGLYTEENVGSVRDWSKELLSVKGVNDELSTVLVAQGVVMGLSIERSQHLISVAADMKDIVGSEAAAFDLLSRAATGDERALKSLGKQFGITTNEGTTLEQMLGKIEARVDGNAAAQVRTFKGEWNLLAEEIGNLAEEKGEPLLRFLTAVPDAMREVSSALEVLNARFKTTGEMLTSNFIPGLQALSILGLAQDISDANDEFARTQSLLQSGHAAMGVTGTVSSHEGSTYKDPNDHGIFYSYTDLEEGAKRLQEKRNKLIDAEQKAADADKRMAETIQKNWETPIEYWERLLKEQEKIAEETNNFLRDLDSLLEEQRRALQDRLTGGEEFGPTRESLAESITQETEAFFLDIDALLGEMGDLQQRLTGGETFGPTRSTLQQSIAQETEAFFNSFTAGEERAARALESLAQASDAAAYGVANIVDAALRGGDVGQAAISLGSGLVSSAASSLATPVITSGLTSALGASLGTALAPGIGSAVGSVAGSVFESMFSSGPQSIGGQLREALSGALSDAGFTAGSYQAATDADFYATGQADFWQKISEQIVGSDQIGQGGQMLMGAFDGLGLSIGDTIGVMGDLIASAQGLSDAQGDQLAAQTALLSNAAFTRAELGQLAQAFGDATNFMEEQERLQTLILEDAQAYAEATGAAKEEALTQLEQDRAAYIGLLADQAAIQEASDEALISALMAQEGMSEGAATALVNSQHSVAQNTGEMVTALWSINSLLGGSTITTTTGGNPPPGPGEGGGGEAPDIRYDYTRGSRESGRVNVYISGVVGNHDDVALKINDSLTNLRRLRRIA